MVVSRTRIIERGWGALLRGWPLAVAVRLAVVAVLAFGPATDEPDELAGWDAERFQDIAERDGRAWADEPVEYPPGSVVVLDRLAGDDVVETHRRLVVLSLALDLGVAGLLARRIGRSTGAAYLVVGLPLVPLGYQRLDTLVTAVAVVGALAVLAAANRSAGGQRAAVPARPAVDVVAGVALAVGALVKIWPAVLAVPAVALGRWRTVVTAAVVGVAAGAAWLVAAGDGLEPVDQVLSLRGADGWHVESLPGSLVALTTGDAARLELNAYRIGTVRPAVVTVGRALAVGAMLALAVAGRRSIGRGADPVSTVGLTALGATAALLATAPLLSPQFLVWTTPWIALILAPGRARTGMAPAVPGRAVGAAAVAAAAGVLTGVTLTLFRPDGLTDAVPALLLVVRNLLLLAVPILCVRALLADERGRTDVVESAGATG